LLKVGALRVLVSGALKFFTLPKMADAVPVN